MCIFCEIIKGNIPNYTVYEDDKCLAFLDISQATIGHTLVVPKQHYENIFELDEDTAKHIFNVVRIVANNVTVILLYPLSYLVIFFGIFRRNRVGSSEFL